MTAKTAAASFLKADLFINKCSFHLGGNGAPHFFSTIVSVADSGKVPRFYQIFQVSRGEIILLRQFYHIAEISSTGYQTLQNNFVKTCMCKA